MNILKNKFKYIFLVLVLLTSLTLTGCFTKEFKDSIKIDEIFTMEESEYYIYFYLDECPFCEDCYKVVNKYYKNNSNNEIKLYLCNLSYEKNEIIRRKYEGSDGQGSKGTYYVDGVTEYTDLYISGAPSLIKINKDKTSTFITSGRSKITNFFNELNSNNKK